MLLLQGIVDWLFLSVQYRWLFCWSPFPAPPVCVSNTHLQDGWLPPSRSARPAALIPGILLGLLSGLDWSSVSLVRRGCRLSSLFPAAAAFQRNALPVTTPDQLLRLVLHGYPASCSLCFHSCRNYSRWLVSVCINYLMSCLITRKPILFFLVAVFSLVLKYLTCLFSSLCFFCVSVSMTKNISCVSCRYYHC